MSAVPYADADKGRLDTSVFRTNTIINRTENVQP